MTVKEIRTFREDYWFLSNFYPCTIIHDGLEYGSLEAAFQASKCADLSERVRFQTLAPAEAKKVGRTIMLRNDWERVKLLILAELVRTKFWGNPELLSELLATGDALLVEDNSWHDNFYGNCTCARCRDTKGLNHLGNMLMRFRNPFWVASLKHLSVFMLLKLGNEWRSNMAAELIRFVKDTYRPGVRVRLIHMEREPQMPEGLSGLVTHVDDIGQIHVSWENGSSLALICDVDRFIAFTGPTAGEYLRGKYAPDKAIRFREETPGCCRAVTIDLEQLINETEAYADNIVSATCGLAGIARMPYDAVTLYDAFLSEHVLSEEDAREIEHRREFSAAESEAGICPKCGSNRLRYGEMQLEDTSVVYPWECNTCGSKGKEYGTVIFDAHYVDKLPDAGV